MRSINHVPVASAQRFRKTRAFIPENSIYADRNLPTQMADKEDPTGGTSAPLPLQLDDSTLEAIIEGVTRRILTARRSGGPAEQGTSSATGPGKLAEAVSFFPCPPPARV